MNDFYIYMYLHPNTKKPVYIGKGTGERAYNMAAHYTHNKHLKEIYGHLKSCRRHIKIILSNLTEKQALTKEKELIREYGRLCKGGILVNKSPGGKQPPNQTGNTWKLSEQTKNNMSKAWTPERRKKWGKYQSSKSRDWGHKISEGKRKFKFDKEEFEQLVLEGKKLFEIEKSFGISRDIMYDRLKLTYGTNKFREITSRICKQS